jgi:transcriptional repressor NrdR
MDMVCVYCSGPTKVNNSRLKSRANAIWRRRECLECASIFTTLEHADSATLLMVRSIDGSLEPFSRDALFISVYECCKHRPRAIDDASGLTQTILTNILATQKDATVSRDQIVDTVISLLKRFDSVAATIYRAYHHSS